MRIGQGIDVHAFGPGNHVMLCGIRIEHNRGLEAHSDGDVALHALMDAMLGALGLGDIGEHFPPADPRYAGADSGELLKHVHQLIEQKGYQLSNMDMTILCEEPKILPHRANMIKMLGQLLKVNPNKLSVKATTTEKLGFTGRREGIAASVVLLLEQITPG